MKPTKVTHHCEHQRKDARTFADSLAALVDGLMDGRMEGWSWDGSGMDGDGHRQLFDDTLHSLATSLFFFGCCTSRTEYSTFSGLRM